MLRNLRKWLDDESGTVAEPKWIEPVEWMLIGFMIAIGLFH